MSQNDQITQQLRVADGLVGSVIRNIFMDRLYLYLIIVILGLVDGGLLYWKLTRK